MLTLYIFGGTAYMFRIKYNGRSQKINKCFFSDGIVSIDTLLTYILAGWSHLLVMSLRCWNSELHVPTRAVARQNRQIVYTSAALRAVVDFIDTDMQAYNRGLRIKVIALFCTLLHIKAVTVRFTLMHFQTHYCLDIAVKCTIRQSFGNAESPLKFNLLYVVRYSKLMITKLFPLHISITVQTTRTILLVISGLTPRHKIDYFFYIRDSVLRNFRSKKSNEMQQYADIYLVFNYSKCFGHLSSFMYS